MITKRKFNLPISVNINLEVSFLNQERNTNVDHDIAEVAEKGERVSHHGNIPWKNQSKDISTELTRKTNVVYKIMFMIYLIWRYITCLRSSYPTEGCSCHTKNVWLKHCKYFITVWYNAFDTKSRLLLTGIAEIKK